MKTKRSMFCSPIPVHHWSSGLLHVIELEEFTLKNVSLEMLHSDDADDENYTCNYSLSEVYGPEEEGATGTHSVDAPQRPTAAAVVILRHKLCTHR